MNIVVDPEVSGEDLRQQLYAGSLVILTRLKALSDFVDYTREELTELFKPHDPEHVHRTHRSGRDGRAPRYVETSLHTRGKVEEARPRDHPGGGVLGRGYALRPA